MQTQGHGQKVGVSEGESAVVDKVQTNTVELPAFLFMEEEKDLPIDFPYSCPGGDSLEDLVLVVRFAGGQNPEMIWPKEQDIPQREGKFEAFLSTFVEGV